MEGDMNGSVEIYVSDTMGSQVNLDEVIAVLTEAGWDFDPNSPEMQDDEE